MTGEELAFRFPSETPGNFYAFAGAPAKFPVKDEQSSLTHFAIGAACTKFTVI